MAATHDGIEVLDAADEWLVEPVVERGRPRLSLPPRRLLLRSREGDEVEVRERDDVSLLDRTRASLRGNGHAPPRRYDVVADDRPVLGIQRSAMRGLRFETTVTTAEGRPVGAGAGRAVRLVQSEVRLHGPEGAAVGRLVSGARTLWQLEGPDGAEWGEITPAAPGGSSRGVRYRARFAPTTPSVGRVLALAGFVCRDLR